jgi:inosine/xanthosine triphosphate pyrophosphatase family protein
MDILIGTKNAYKAGEMMHYLDGIEGVRIHELADSGVSVKVEEDQDSLLGNARKKAKEISMHTDFYVLTSDGGNDIPGLGDRWDVLRNQRIVGEDSTDREKVIKLMSLMEGIEDRKVEEHFALALGYKGEVIWSAEDVIDRGYIVEKADDGEIPPYKWMGWVWYYPEFNKTYTSLSEEEIAKVRMQSMDLKNLLRKEIEKLAATMV